MIDGWQPVHMLFANVLSSLTHVKTGRLRALAVTTARRSAVLPDLPTIAEAGVPGYENSTWFGVLAPAGTPVSIVSKLNAELVKTTRSPDIIERLAPDGGEPVGSTPEQFARHLVAEWPAGAVVGAGISSRMNARPLPKANPFTAVPMSMVAAVRRAARVLFSGRTLKHLLTMMLACCLRCHGSSWPRVR